MTTLAESHEATHAAHALRHAHRSTLSNLNIANIGQTNPIPQSGGALSVTQPQQFGTLAGTDGPLGQSSVGFGTGIGGNYIGSGGSVTAGGGIL